MLLLGCSSVGREQDGEQGSGVPQKGVAGGGTCGALGTSQAGHVFGEHGLQGPSLHGGSLWHAWRCPLSLGGKKGRGVDLSCSRLGLGKQGGDLLCGAEDLLCLHGCAFRAGIQVQHSPWGALWHTSLQALDLCTRPVLLLLSQCHVGWVGGSGSWCPEHEVSWQDQDRGWSRPPAPPSAHVRLPVPRR